MISKRKSTEKYTYSDYLQWPDDERWELIDGKPYNMSPAPSTKHQRVALRFGSFFDLLLQGKSCVAFVAPTDVVLSEYDVVQPDAFVVCDRSKIKDKNIQGAPDLVIEVLSGHTAKKDRWDKKYLYKKYGVREYLIVDPEGLYAERYLLTEERRFDRGQVFDSQETLTLKSLESVEINLWEIFEVKREDASPPLES
ncbi:MAG: Uma2 family endonuclease [Candidatus Omnitrophota bacterium]